MRWPPSPRAALVAPLSPSERARLSALLHRLLHHHYGWQPAPADVDQGQ